LGQQRHEDETGLIQEGSAALNTLILGRKSPVEDDANATIIISILCGANWAGAFSGWNAILSMSARRLGQSVS
jgi:hypothetical protein